MTRPHPATWLFWWEILQPYLTGPPGKQSQGPWTKIQTQPLDLKQKQKQKTPDRQQFKGGRIHFGSWFTRIQSIMFGKKRQPEGDTAAYIVSIARKQGCMLKHTYFSHFSFIFIPYPSAATTHSLGGSSQLNLSGNVLQSHPEICLLSNSKSSQVDRGDWSSKTLKPRKDPQDSDRIPVQESWSAK